MSQHLADIHLFARVLEIGSVRAAAADLGVPRSTLSRRIAALEAALGVRLLERTTQTVRATEAGVEFYQRVAPALGEIAEASRIAGEQTTTLRGSLRISAPTLLGSLQLGAIFAEFSALHPDVKLVVELSDKVVDLVADGFDLGLRSGAVRDGSLVAKAVGHATIGIYASPEYLRRHGEPRHPDELSSHRLLLLGSGAGAAPWSFVVDGARVDRAPIGAITCTSQLTLRDAAIAGAGLARLPGFVVAEAIRLERLVEVLADYTAPPRPFYVVWPSGRFVSAKVKAFAALLAERLPPGLAGLDRP